MPCSTCNVLGVKVHTSCRYIAFRPMLPLCLQQCDETHNKRISGRVWVRSVYLRRVKSQVPDEPLGESGMAIDEAEIH